jgi:hypothetical protein
MVHDLDNSRLDRPRKVRNALLVFGSCGALGVLVDVDHAYVLLQKALPITASNLIYNAGRPWHLPLLLVLGALCCLAGAHVYRLRAAL